MAEAMAGITPFHFGFNNPVAFNDPTGLAPCKFDSVEDMVSYAVNFTEEGETGTLTNEGNGNFGFTQTKVTEPSAEDKAFMEANGGGTLMPSVEVTGETLHVRQGLDRAWSAAKT